jgi:hypothetical protein
MVIRRSRFDDLNQETSTKLIIGRIIGSIIVIFLALSAILGAGVFLITHS